MVLRRIAGLRQEFMVGVRTWFGLVSQSWVGWLGLEGGAVECSKSMDVLTKIEE